jgi:hypothetical protein
LTSTPTFTQGLAVDQVGHEPAQLGGVGHLVLGLAEHQA